MTKYLSQPDIFLALAWIATVLLYLLFQSSFNPLTTPFIIHLSIFLTFFSLFYRVTSKTLSKIKTKNIKPFLSQNFLYTLALISFFYSIYKLILIFGTFNFDSAMGFRSTIGGDDQIESIGNGISFPLLCASYYISHKNSNRKISYFFLLLSLLIAIASTSKIFIMILMLYIALLNINHLSAIKVAILIFIFLLLFSASHIVLEKYSSNPDDSLFDALANTLAVYIFGGIAAFQNIINGKIILHPNVMLYGLKGVLTNYTNMPTSNILPWTEIGDWYTNVYTAFGYWYSAFGSYFSIIMAPLLGLYYGFFINNNKLLKKAFDFYSIFLFFALFFTLFGDQYIPALFMHIGFLVSSLIIFLTKSNKQHYNLKTF